MKYITFFLILNTIIGGCQQDKNNDLLINDSKLITSALLNTIKTKEYDKMEDFYSADFYTYVTAEQWVSDVKKIDETFGCIESYELIETLINTENGQTSIILTYIVKRKQRKSEERFEIWPIDNKVKIRAHNIKI